MEDKIFYTMLYEATYPDSGVISYKPIKVVKGFYNVDDDTFKDKETNEVYSSVNMTIPTFGKDQEHLLDALSDEIETYGDEQQLFFAFPIEEERALEYCDRDVFQGQDPLELYEREIRGYFLYSVYDESVDDNIFYVIDKLEDHHIYNIDVSLEIVEAVATANNMTEPTQQLLVLVAGGNSEDLNLDNLELDTDQQPLEEVKPDTAIQEIKFDFDPDQLEEDITSEVIGQDHVVRALVSMMYKNKRYHAHDGLKSNMLILGPSGCGKTEIVRSMSRHLNIPMTIFDATSASASGYVGNSVTQAIKDLISVCNGDIARAEHGIIVIDEIDKLASIGSDGVSKGDVQDELFKMLEGDEITIAADSYRDKSFRFNPKNVTFIGIGSAQALIEQKKKDDAKRPIGFGSVTEQKKEEPEKEIELTPEDLIKFGLKPELLRRLNIIKVVKNLKKDDLVTILTDSKISNLRLYEAAFRDVDHVSLVCDREVLDDIAEKATKEKAGASGLKRVVDDMLQTSVRKIRMLKGKPGELVLSKETLEDPDKFELYSLEGQNKEMVYPKIKVKK